MTEAICQTDAYARVTEASVAEVLPDGVVLDRTVFYARGGGQPGDIGRIRWEAGEAAVIDTFKRDGRYVHWIDGGAGPPAAAAVHAETDWERRHLLMRTHTALHVLSGIVWRD